MKRTPRTPATPARIAAALALGFSATVACAAVTAPNDARSAEIHPLTAEAQGKDTAPSQDPGDGGAPDGSDNKYPACPHGALEDPHRGFIRCLGPGEKSPFAPAADGGAPDAPPPDAAPAKDNGNAGKDSDNPGKDSGNAGKDSGNAGAPGKDDSGAGKDSGGSSGKDSGNPGNGSDGNNGAGNNGTADAGAPGTQPPPPPEPPKPGPPPLVEMKSPKFENGDVPRAEKSLTNKKVLEAVAKCVSEAGGLTGKTATLKVEFLVRVRGKAEGVEVTPKGVSDAAAKCVRTFLKNRTVGTPTADPVGVTVVYTLKPSGK